MGVEGMGRAVMAAARRRAAGSGSGQAKHAALALILLPCLVLHLMGAARWARNADSRSIKRVRRAGAQGCPVENCCNVPRLEEVQRQAAWPPGRSRILQPWASFHASAPMPASFALQDLTPLESFTVRVTQSIILPLSDTRMHAGWQKQLRAQPPPAPRPRRRQVPPA